MPSLADEGTAHTHRTPEFTPTIQRAQADLSQYRLTVAAILASPFATNLPDEAYVHHRTPILPAHTIERLNPTSELEVMSKHLDLTAKSLECPSVRSRFGARALSYAVTHSVETVWTGLS
ncbi:hypothetical protein BKA62DRAFT_779957 [Auriculariales sp. MPI-PUGE-AT-0066]|nr:hypothetical protein BKA62DRAFT_779957 [Auriculariales sp. MPI-PUGE-AT-0066]